MKLWNSHPKVYLDVAHTGEGKCPLLRHRVPPEGGRRWFAQGIEPPAQTTPAQHPLAMRSMAPQGRAGAKGRGLAGLPHRLWGGGACCAMSSAKCRRSPPRSLTSGATWGLRPPGTGAGRAGVPLPRHGFLIEKRRVLGFGERQSVVRVAAQHPLGGDMPNNRPDR